MKRDELGAVFQMCVSPGHQRKLIAATLLQAVFDRAPYGCKLFCCWCAQDLEANHFWESMGFVPLAFRTGSEKKSRVHIFWQKRIRKDDTTTQWWFPSQTTGGAIGAGRIVLPIPHGTHWSDVMPLILPNEPAKELAHEETKIAKKEAKKSKLANTTSQLATLPPPRRVRFGAPGLVLPTPIPEIIEKKQKTPKPKAAKVDPRLIIAARELRDRWLEGMNEAGMQSFGKYDVTRVIESTASIEPMKLLAA